MVNPVLEDVEPGTKAHTEMVKVIMRVEQIITDALPDASPNEVMRTVAAMFAVAGVYVGKLRSIELVDDVDEILKGAIVNFHQGVAAGEQAGRRTILEHFGGEL